MSTLKIQSIIHNYWTNDPKLLAEITHSSDIFEHKSTIPFGNTRNSLVWTLILNAFVYFQYHIAAHFFLRFNLFQHIRWRCEIQWSLSHISILYTMWSLVATKLFRLCAFQNGFSCSCVRSHSDVMLHNFRQLLPYFRMYQTIYFVRIFHW